MVNKTGKTKKNTRKSTGKSAASNERKSRKNTSVRNEQKIAEIHRMQDERDRHKRVNDIIWGLVFIAFGAFIFAALQFRVAGEIGNAFGGIIKGLFGHVAYVLPWYMMVVGLVLIIGKAAHFSWKTSIGIFVIFISLCVLNSARFIDDDFLNFFIKNFYLSGKRLESGGVCGMSIGIALIKATGRAGLYIFSTVAILICLLLTLNSPLLEWLTVMKNRREARRLAEEEYFDDEDDFEQPVSDCYETAERRRPRSNVLDFIKTDDPYGSLGRQLGESSAEENEPVLKGYGVDNDSGTLNGDAYNPKPPTKQEIAKDAAKIGQQIGLGAGDTALTKASDRKSGSKYRKPSVNLLSPPTLIDKSGISKDLKAKARLLEETMHNFNVDAKVVQVTQGPAVTRYEIQPNTGVKVSKIVGLADDIALNLRAKSIRMEAPIPGKAAVGIEVENEKINMVTLREIINSREFRDAQSKITFAVGKNISGKPIVANLKDMPHLLIAGSTGSGKSVCINSIITSLLYKANPDEVKLVLIDPKVVELGNYNGIPHLLIPVVTEPSKAAAALNWAVVEMTNRYKMFAEENVKDLASYNRKMQEKDTPDMYMPQIVIIIDELADLMMAAPSQVEDSICRLAQMARAAGMHLIVATQRPSVDIITGLIKANIPSRIAFAVSSQADSRTILDRGGAEHLVGKGDMLFNPLGIGTALRVQGTFVSDKEVQRVIDHVKSQVDEIKYADEVIDTIENNNISNPEKDDDADELLAEATECVVMQGQASTSMIQRRFRVGYNRAARIMDQLEARGVIGPQDGARPRKVLISEEEFTEH